ncbi:ionotropic receptor 20a-related [Holotrichia oblita]|uniref:Ionotropic receptor 20a-related n=1 Tax=Holotrichia oblita TaxID=644536 RepID=A0ACB9SUH9_HOLOL|nr:ionotropic receptor 20a-related [Holotrichia oblita]
MQLCPNLTGFVTVFQIPMARLEFITVYRNNNFEYNGNLSYVYVKLNGIEIPYNLVFRSYGCQGIVITCQSPVSIFENLELGMKLGSDRFNFRKYLFLTVTNQLETSLDVLKSKAAEFVADILIVAVDSDESIFDLYTHKFAGPKEKSTDITWLDRWYSINNSFLFDSNLYPDKLENLEGRPFRIICFTYKPYCIIDPPDGTDMLVALEYARKHNMTPELVVDEAGEWGNLYDNWTGNGVVGNLAQDMGDIGALYTWEREYSFFDYSKPTMRSGITCIAPAPRLASGLATPFVSFSMELWIMTLSSYFLASVALLIVLSVTISDENDKKRNVNNIMLSLSLAGRIFLLQSFQKVPNLEQSRITFGLALILSLMLNTIYSSGLSSTMTIPRYYGTIHDADDLAASEIKWGATSTAWIESIDSDSRKVFVQIVKNFQILTEKELAAFNDEDLAYAVEHLQGGNLALGSYISLDGIQRRRLLDEDLYWEYCVLMLRKNSIFLSSLNDVILAVTESGLLYYWEHQTVYKYMDMNMQKAVKMSLRANNPGGSNSIVKLNLDHVIGAFTIWGVGILISIIVFICELIKNKYNRGDNKV